jgi:hypothetical protein
MKYHHEVSSLLGIDQNEDTYQEVRMPLQKFLINCYHT